MRSKVKALNEQIEDQRMRKCFICGLGATSLRTLYKAELKDERELGNHYVMNIVYGNHKHEGTHDHQEGMMGVLKAWLPSLFLDGGAQSNRAADELVLQQHAQGAHSMWSWLYFYQWAKWPSKWMDGSLHGEVKFVLQHIEDGCHHVFPIHVKERSTDIWATGPFTEATSEDVRLAWDHIRGELKELRALVTRSASVT